MSPLLDALPTPELAALLLVIAIPVVLSLLVWPLLRSRSKQRSRKTVAGEVNPVQPQIGLAGQWIVRSRQIEAGIENQRAVIRLHHLAGAHLAAIDYEVDRLLRDIRNVLAPSVTH